MGVVVPERPLDCAYQQTDVEDRNTRHGPRHPPVFVCGRPGNTTSLSDSLIKLCTLVRQGTPSHTHPLLLWFKNCFGNSVRLSRPVPRPGRALFHAPVSGADQAIYWRFILSYRSARIPPHLSSRPSTHPLPGARVDVSLKREKKTYYYSLT